MFPWKSSDIIQDSCIWRNSLNLNILGHLQALTKRGVTGWVPTFPVKTALVSNPRWSPDVKNRK